MRIYRHASSPRAQVLGLSIAEGGIQINLVDVRGLGRLRRQARNFNRDIHNPPNYYSIQ